MRGDSTGSLGPILHIRERCSAARAYYDHLRNDKNKSHHVAVRSLAFKWLRIIYRCWKDGKPYDEAIYMQSLRRRGSLLAGILGTPTGVGWKSVAGFQKLSENSA